MNDLLKIANGYKTYIAAAGLLAAAWYYYSEGNTAHAMELVGIALGLVGLRHALTKQDAAAKPPVVEQPKT
jgi:hypothetical protein